MTRHIYRALLQLHPAPFRDRFGGEMMSIFEHSGHRPRLIADAALSLTRQWLLRADFRHIPEPVPTGPQMFLPLTDHAALRGRHWLMGFALSLLSFGGASILLNHGGNNRASTIGSHNPAEYGSRIQGEATPRHLDTEIEARPPEILDTFTGRAMVQQFYRAIRVLSALDTDHNLVLSPSEIANAPAVLRSLDRNHDGALEPAECIRPRPYATEADPMRTSPALAALDADHDQIISAQEIRNAVSSLKLLDKDHDGYLKPEELLSPAQLNRLKEVLQ